MSTLPEKWRDKRPRRALKPWSPTARGVMVVDMRPTVRVAEENRLACCFLNETGGLIWQLCDGQRDVGTIIAEVATHYQRSEEVVGPDVCLLLDGLQTAGLVQVDGESFF